MNDDIADIGRLAATYFDGFYDSDVKKLSDIFLPTATLTHSVDGVATCAPRDAWLQRVASRPSPKASGLTRHDEIVSIDIAGPSLAYLKVRCAAPPKHFTDLLSCLKVNGKWMIAQKVFMTETR